MPAKITEERYVESLRKINSTYVDKYKGGILKVYATTELLSPMKRRTAREHVERFVRLDIPSPYARIRRILMKPHGVTMYTLLLRHHDKSTVRLSWQQYKKKQALTNGLDYKRERYGWSEQDFDEYNKSRAATLSNFTSRHGKEVGALKWEAYLNAQRYAGVAVEYFIEKYGSVEGPDRFDEINRSKAHSLENMINRHGPLKGAEMWEKYISNVSPGWSKVSQSLFVALNDPEAYYATSNKGKEYGIKTKDGYYKIDFVNGVRTHAIEFNGDYWHANPKVYGPDSVIMGIKASDVWEKDCVKSDIITNTGMKLLVVWESEFVQDPEECIKKCQEFLQTTS